MPIFSINNNNVCESDFVLKLYFLFNSSQLYISQFAIKTPLSPFNG